MALTMVNNTERKRYEARLGDEVAGYADYMLADKLVVFTHTEVDPSYEGQGVGGSLIRFALDDVRHDGRRDVLPLCPFVKGWMQRHPDYLDLQYGALASHVTD